MTGSGGDGGGCGGVAQATVGQRHPLKLGSLYTTLTAWQQEPGTSLRVESVDLVVLVPPGHADSCRVWIEGDRWFQSSFGKPAESRVVELANINISPPSQRQP